MRGGGEHGGGEHGYIASNAHLLEEGVDARHIRFALLDGLYNAQWWHMREGEKVRLATARWERERRAAARDTHL